MIIRRGFLAPYGGTVRKKLGRIEDQAEHPEYGIYQMRKCKTGKEIVKMKFYRPPESRTPAQDAIRLKYAAAVLAWKALTKEQQKPYLMRTAKKHYTGYNLFLKEYMLN